MMFARMTFAVERKGEPMFEVPYGQDPYSAIGKYIRENITIIEDIIAVIEINGVETNELFMVDMNEDGYFIWNSDWYEGEENVVLIDFFPVSEAINSSAQPNALVGDTISRQAAIDEIRKCRFVVDAIEKIKGLQSAQPERTCVNCGRTVNNGGWYPDGRTRCPIEEHYALPKDGHCHLWEKRNVTDDDYPERRTDD